MTGFSATLSLAVMAGGIAAVLASAGFAPASAYAAGISGTQRQGQAVEAQLYRPGQYGGQRGCRTVMRYLNGRRIVQRVCS